MNFSAIDRRSFLKAGLAALTLPAFPSLSWGAEEEKFFVLISVFGGMDVTLGLDPWLEEQRPAESDLFLEYRADEVRRENGLALGPAATSLMPHAREIAVVNGVMVSAQDNGHPAAALYMNTGNGESHAPDLPVEIALATGVGPYGVMTDSALFLANRVVSQSRTQDVFVASKAQDPTALIEGLNTTIARESPLARALREVVAAKTTTQKLNEALGRLSHDAEGRPIEKAEDYKIMAAAFAVGAAKQGRLQIYEGDLDTHTDHPKRHLRIQKASWDRVAAVFDYFKSIPYRESNLFSQTTFLVVSEFSRTPYLNPSRGKDHNPLTNSVLFAGRGVAGGKCVGGSRLVPRARSPIQKAYHTALPILQNGRVAPSPSHASFIFPETIAMTAAQIMGARAPAFASVPAGTKPLMSVIR